MRKLLPYYITCTLIGILLGWLVYPTPKDVRAASTFAPIACDNWTPVSSASSLQIVTAGNSNMFVYLCSDQLGSIGGSDFSIVEGTGTTCASNTVGMVGGATAAAGIGLAANGTTDVGSGVGAIAKTKTAGDNVCIIMSGTGPLAGVIGWTQAPN